LIYELFFITFVKDISTCTDFNLVPLPQGWFRHRFPVIFLYICMDLYLYLGRNKEIRGAYSCARTTKQLDGEIGRRSKRCVCYVHKFFFH
jgi:hypothetical protein